MSEKVADRLFRVTCSAYGTKNRVIEVIEAMTDEQLSETFDALLENFLQSADVVIPEMAPDRPQREIDYLAAGGLHCPVCQSEDIIGESWTAEGGTCWQEVYCGECGSRWTDDYDLVGLTILHDSRAPIPDPGPGH